MIDYDSWLTKDDPAEKDDPPDDREDDPELPRAMSRAQAQRLFEKLEDY